MKNKGIGLGAFIFVDEKSVKHRHHQAAVPVHVEVGTFHGQLLVYVLDETPVAVETHQLRQVVVETVEVAEM